MVPATPVEPSRYRFDRVWGMGHMEASIRPNPERVSRSRRAGVHDSKRSRRHHIHPIRAWAILTLIALSTGATFVIFYLQWRYR